jgi:hypothetical protein
MPLWILADDASQDSLADMPKSWPHQNQLIDFCQHMSPGMAALLIMMGMVYLMWGFKMFKLLVLLNAAILGGFVGASATKGGETAIAAAVVGAVFAAAVAWPTMKYAVALMGGVFGAILGAAIWHGVDLDDKLLWAGALTGLVTFGLLSFVLFRASVMMYTALQGSVMLVFGILGLVYKYQEVGPKLTTHLSMEPLLLPAFVFIPACIGWVFQHHKVVGASVGGNSGSGGGKKKGGGD